MFRKDRVFSLQSKNGKSYEVDVPPAKSDMPASYAFAFPRGGSTLLNNMLSSYCSEVGLPWVSLYDQAFSQGVATGLIAQDVQKILSEPGRIYLGFRHYPRFDFRIPPDSKTILLIRDPRDVLTSLYFSVKHSHALKNESIMRANLEANIMGINEFVIDKAQHTFGIYQSYEAKLINEGLKVYRYEDVVFDKFRWLRDMVETFGLPVYKRVIKKVAKGHDVKPLKEDITKHVRSVIPGDHTRKLEAATIYQLNQIFSSILKTYNYK